MVTLQQIEQLIVRAATAAFEDFTFSLVELLPPSREVEAIAGIYTWISCLEPVNAPISLYLPRTLLKRVLTDVHMLPEEQITSEIEADLAGEIANTFCGQLVRHFLPGTSFNLGLPQVSHELPALRTPMTLFTVTVEGLPVQIRVADQLIEAVSPAALEPDAGACDPPSSAGSPDDAW